MGKGLEPDMLRLEDFRAFAAAELEAADMEPWALVLAELRHRLPLEDVHWLVKGYNAYDSLESAWRLYAHWPSPQAWAVSQDGHEAALLECTQERRNLRGGRVLQHLSSYTGRLMDTTQDEWLRRPLTLQDASEDFNNLYSHVSQIWGVGRQTAFEWVEFLGKVLGFPVTAAHGYLWDSEGPRRALQRLYGRQNPDRGWLQDAAEHARQMLADNGIHTVWEDFETLICDFNVMRDGRYYPGRHLAALREEINAVPEPGKSLLEDGWRASIPAGWQGIAPGIRKDLLPIYRNTGRLVTMEESLMVPT